MLTYYEFTAAVRNYGLANALWFARTLGVPMWLALIYTNNYEMESK